MAAGRKSDSPLNRNVIHTSRNTDKLGISSCSLTAGIDNWIVSDTASVDIRADKSGPTILEILTQQGFTCRQPFVVPDDVSRIQDCVKQWCGQGDIDLLVTTGGTGFGVRDKTPEVSVTSYS